MKLLRSLFLLMILVESSPLMSQSSTQLLEYVESGAAGTEPLLGFIYMAPSLLLCDQASDRICSVARKLSSPPRTGIHPGIAALAGTTLLMYDQAEPAAELYAYVQRTRLSARNPTSAEAVAQLIALLGSPAEAEQYVRSLPDDRARQAALAGAAAGFAAMGDVMQFRHALSAIGSAATRMDATAAGATSAAARGHETVWRSLLAESSPDNKQRVLAAIVIGLVGRCDVDTAIRVAVEHSLTERDALSALYRHSDLLGGPDSIYQLLPKSSSSSFAAAHSSLRSGDY